MATNSSRLPGSLDPLLLSNDRPSPGQASSISEVIETLTHDLSNIDARIACLKTEVAQLETTKSTLQHGVERYSSLLSSVRQLPPEIIRVVMLACFDEDDFDQDQVRRLGLVSRQWFQVAVSTPRLWSSYTIDTEGLDKESVASVIHKASTHLSKAASLPLHLRYTVDCGGPDSTHALDYIHSLSPQLRVLHIDLISETQDDVAGEFNTTLTRLFRPPTIWPVLHTLSLIMHTDQGYFDDYLTDVFPSPAQSFPVLKVVELDLVGESLSPRAVRGLQNWGMPCAQLSRLFIGPCAVCSPSDVVDILRESTSLEECYIDVPGYNDSYWGVYSTDAHITLPKVTMFTLKAEDEWITAGILNHLTLPSLRHYHHDLYMGYDFEVPNPEHPDPGESPAWQAANAILHPIIELFTRSECSATLETLDLNLASGLKALAYAGGDNIKELFALVPQLKRLSLSGRDRLPDGLLDCLPKSVDDLDVEVSFPPVGQSQKDFVDCVYRQCQALRAAHGGVPQEMKAKFKGAKSKSERYAEHAMQVFKEGNHESVAKLKVEIC